MATSQKPGLWAQTPPAIFPPILGLFGIGLAWRRATEVFPVPVQIGELILGAVSLLFVFAVIAYMAKFLRRPTVMADDLRILPGRAGLSAASVAAMLFAATLVPYSFCAAKWALMLALVAQAIVAFVIVVVLAPAPLAQRRFTAVWHLTFVGFVVSASAAVPLGARIMTEVILVLTIPAAITIWVGHAYLMSKSPVPAPLRPTLAVHLAPACVFGIAAGLLGYIGLATLFGWMAIGGMAVLLARARYLTAAGFSPLWGAFTFPFAAFVNLMLILGAGSGLMRVIGGIALIAGTLVIPVIAYKVMKMWAAGKLAAVTNAARL